jgi:hypothetical protein
MTLPLLGLAAALAAPAHVHADLLSNGGFETGLSGWTVVDQVGSDGSFLDQTGTASPLNGFPVSAPPQGTRAAMTDSFGPGSHVLYQDFVVPASVTDASVGFSLYFNNQDVAYRTPATLDFATPALNQQARVDLISSSADPFSVAVGDILLSLYQTAAGDPLVSGYTDYLIDVTTLFQAHPGETLRLRFAEVDNVANFNFGVDGVSIRTGDPSVPEASTWLAVPVAVGLAAYTRQRLRSRTS